MDEYCDTGFGFQLNFFLTYDPGIGSQDRRHEKVSTWKKTS
jgi:hypothetical protein